MTDELQSKNENRNGLENEAVQLKEVHYFDTARQPILGMADIAKWVTGQARYTGTDLSLPHYVKEAIVISADNKCYLSDNFPREWADVSGKCSAKLSDRNIYDIITLEDIALKSNLIYLGDFKQENYRFELDKHFVFKGISEYISKKIGIDGIIPLEEDKNNYNDSSEFRHESIFREYRQANNEKFNFLYVDRYNQYANVNYNKNLKYLELTLAADKEKQSLVLGHSECINCCANKLDGYKMPALQIQKSQ